MRLPIIISPVIFAVLPTPMFAQFGKNSGNTEFAKGDFFIVSSIDLAKKQLLKRPTEVTELMRVDGETRCFEKRGKHQRLADIRPGDSGYITSRSKEGQLVAVTI